MINTLLDQHAMGKYDRIYDRIHKTIVWSLIGVTGVGTVYVGALTYDLFSGGPRASLPHASAPDPSLPTPLLLTM